ncbi:MAG: hypothetical protein QXJ27_03135 [Thermoplasmata archaeon]
MLKHKTKGIEIDIKNGRYYARRVHSEWDPVKKRPKKVTDEYLGVVTPEGIIPSKHRRKPMAILECGNINYIAKFAKNNQ